MDNSLCQDSNNTPIIKSFLKETSGLFFQIRNTNPLLSTASAVRECRLRLKSAHIIIHERRLPPIEAVTPLLQGWKSIAVALKGGAASGFPADYKEIILSAFEKESDLKVLVEPAISDMNWLEKAVEARSSSISFSAPISQYKQAFSNLELSCREVAKFCARESNPKRVRVFNAINLVLLGVIALAILFIIGGGIVHSITLPKQDEGLFAVYFTKPSFKGHPFTRIEHTTHFNLKTSAPVIGLNKSNFSSYFEGCIRTSGNEPRKLLAYSSGPPVLVYIDGEKFLRIKKSKHPGFSKRKVLTEGRHDIRIEVSRGRVPSTIIVGWDDNKKGIIPLGPDDLAPPGGNSTMECSLTIKDSK